MRLLKEEEYPDELIIGEDTYRVIFKRKIPDEKADTVGLCDFNDRIIYIKKGLSELETLRTFIHEVGHAICDEHKINVSHRAIYKLELAIADFLTRNF